MMSLLYRVACFQVGRFAQFAHQPPPGLPKIPKNGEFWGGAHLLVPFEWLLPPFLFLKMGLCRPGAFPGKAGEGGFERAKN